VVAGRGTCAVGESGVEEENDKSKKKKNKYLTSDFKVVCRWSLGVGLALSEKVE